ncbi:MAG: hypothetical protein V1847_04780 [Candidatus Diapherotrites archaeon]
MPVKPKHSMAEELIYFVEWTSQLTYLLYFVMLVSLINLLLVFQFGAQFNAFEGMFAGGLGEAVIMALILFGIILMVAVYRKRSQFEKQIKKHAP